LIKNEVWITRFKQVLKPLAEQLKIELSHSTSSDIYTDEPLGEDMLGNEIDFDCTVERHEFDDAVRPVLQTSIDIANQLLAKNNISGKNLKKILAVGGSTNIPLLQTMIKEQISENLDTSVDPMTCVTIGAALYASTQDNPEEEIIIDKSKMNLKLKYPSTTVEDETHIGIMIDSSKTESKIPDKPFVEFLRADKGWSSGKLSLEDGAEIITVPLISGINSFQVNFYDEKGNKYDTEPEEIAIICGIEAAKPTLPYALCPEIYDPELQDRFLYKIVGLEKNQTLPAKGKSIFKTIQPLRPGNKNDTLIIPIYNGDPENKAVYYERAGTLVITGEDVDEVLPEGSEIELTLKVDTSKIITVSVYIPRLDETIEKEFASGTKDIASKKSLENTINDLKNEVNKHASKTSNSATQAYRKTNLKLDDLFDTLEKNPDEDSRLKIEEQLIQLQKDLDMREREQQWPKEFEKSQLLLNDLDKNIQTLMDQNKKTEMIQKYEKFKNDLSQISFEKNLHKLRLLKSQIINEMTHMIPLSEMIIGIYISFQKDFEKINWYGNEAEAKQTIQNGLTIFSQLANLKGTPGFEKEVVQKLGPIVEKLYKLSNREIDIPTPWSGLQKS
jgi:molecular chaperone DnaK